MNMLTAPLAYWKVRHPVKRRWDWLVPLVGATALTAMLRLWPAVPAPFGAGGFLSALQNLYALLGGFFIAALTLLSTADTKALRQPLTGHPKITFGSETAPLDRRRFLCLLFGYLSFSCFGLYAVGFAAQMLAPGMHTLLGANIRFWTGTAFLYAYNFWLVHLFASTLVGLYYFTDRLQRPDAEMIRDPDRNPPIQLAE